MSRRKSGIVRFLHLGLITTFIAAAFFVFFFSGFFSIQDIIFTKETRYQDEIRQHIEKTLQGSYWGVVAKRHILFADEAEIEQSILETFKNIKSVHISKDASRRLQVNLMERDGMVLICNGGGCASIDDEGAASRVAPQATFTQYNRDFVAIVDESNTPIREGEIINSDSFVFFAKGIKKALKEKNGIEANGFYVPHPSASELKVKTENGWLLYLNPSVSLVTTSEALNIILAEEIKNENQICIEYIDLRIPDKVFYKLVDDCEELKKQHSG